MKKKIFPVFSVLWSIFIFSNSIKPGSVSTQVSNSPSNILHDFLTFIGLNVSVDVSTIIVRKSAHFIEFFILGALIALSYIFLEKQIKFYKFNILFFGLSVAVLDEFIQTFVVGRTGLVKDIVLDFTGVLTAVILTALMMKYYKKSQYKKGFKKGK
ncbi:MAG: VanZ family protein [Oscillospiraceae bacterium]